MSNDHDKERLQLNTRAFQVQAACLGTNKKAGINPLLSYAPGFNHTSLIVIKTAFVVGTFHEISKYSRGLLTDPSIATGSISARKYLHCAIVSSLDMQIAGFLCCSRTAPRPLYDASVMRVI